MYWSIGDWNGAWNHRNIEVYYLHFVFYLHMIYRQWIYCYFYYYVDRSNNSLIIWCFFNNWDFVQHKLKLSTIVEINRLLVNWKTVYMLLLNTWSKFLSWAKKSGCWKAKKKVPQLCTKLNVCRKYLVKRALLIWIWGKQNKS